MHSERSKVYMLLSTQKSTVLRIINQQQAKLFAICFSQINPDAHVSTKINLITFHKGQWEFVGGGQ